MKYTGNEAGKMDAPTENEVLVRVKEVSKVFCRDFKKSLVYGLKDCVREFTHTRGPSRNCVLAKDLVLRDSEFLAVDNVSFEIKRGECIGLIGHNGAGKTTLLKMLNGLIKPDTGRIEMRGRTGALIALGAGFNPLLTGRENIHVNGAVLGLTRVEIDEKIESIIDFAEVREFIDAPVQSYSSGMSVRLGFAVATALDPDILLLDEVLAVGDIGFVVKCLNRIREVSTRCGVILVSHSMESVADFCTKVIVMEKGIATGPLETRLGIQRYASLAARAQKITGSGGVELIDFKLLSENSVLEDLATLQPGSECSVLLTLQINTSHPLEFDLSIDDISMRQVVGYGLSTDPRMFSESGTYQIGFSIGKVDLNAGKYSFLVRARDPRTRKIILRQDHINPFLIDATEISWAKIVRTIKPEDINISKK